MNREDAMFQAAMEAIDQGNHFRARDLLTRLIKINSKKTQYWLWMSGVVDTTKERVFCLKEVLRLDPKNKDARIGLIRLGKLPPDENLKIPYSVQKRNWNAKLESDFNDKLIKGKKGWMKFVLIGASALILISLVIMGIMGVENSPIGLIMRRRATPTLSKILPTFSLAEEVEITDTPTSVSVTQSSEEAKILYTPTPLYINTPHPMTEAYRTGINSFINGEFEETIKYMYQVATIEPDASDVYYYIGESYRLQGDLQEALSTYTDIIRRDPGFAPAYLGRARARLAATPGRWREAQDDLERAVDFDANFFDAYLDLALLDINQENSETALEWLETAAEINPDSAMLYYLRAQANLLADSPELALKDARQATELDATFPDGYRLLSEIYIITDKPELAVKPLEKYTAQIEDDSEAFSWLGRGYFAQGEIDPAFEALEKALRIDDEQFEAYLQRGMIYLEINEFERALDDFETAISINKVSFESYIGLGRALLELEFFGDAYTQFSVAEAYAETDFDWAKIYYWRAQSLEELDETDVALRDWEALIALPEKSAPSSWIKRAESVLAPPETTTPTPPAQETKVTEESSATPTP